MHLAALEYLELLRESEAANNTSAVVGSRRRRTLLRLANLEVSAWKLFGRGKKENGIKDRNPLTKHKLLKRTLHGETAIMGPHVHITV